jgi:hypothetical protein
MVSFVTGAVDQYFFQGFPVHSISPTELACGLLWSALLFAWFWLDTSERNYARSPGLNVSVIFLSVAGLSYYFFRSRGALRGAIATVLLLLACVVSFVLTYAGKWFAYHALQS